MATERGVIIRAFDTKAIVRTTKSETCAACASRHSCEARGDDREVEVLNPVGAKEGDRVVIHLKSGSFLKATFLMYVFPILCLIGGAFVGERMAMGSGEDSSGLLSMVFAFSFFVVAVFVIKIKGKKMGEQDAYRPKVIRILH